jgi:hypothetical protein
MKQPFLGVVGIDYPELVVFDLDACLWDQEMYYMTALPDRTVRGPLNGACTKIGGGWSRGIFLLSHDFF